jgi:hypothetical protein
MTSPTASTTNRRRTRSGTQKKSSPAASAKATKATKATKTETLPHASVEEGHTVTVTVPLDRMAGTAASVAKAPVDVARKVLPAKGGLPLYLGLGALGVAGVLEWPVALGVGIGYAVLRHGGAMEPEHTGGNGGRTDSD